MKDAFGRKRKKQQFSLFRDNRSSWVVLSKHLLKNKGKDLFSNQKNSKQNLNFKIEIFRPQTGGHQNGRFRLMDIDHIQRKRKRKTERKSFQTFIFKWLERKLDLTFYGLNIQSNILRLNRSKKHFIYQTVIFSYLLTFISCINLHKNNCSERVFITL